MENVSVNVIIQQAVSYVNEVGKPDEIDMLAQAAANGNIEIAKRFVSVKKGLADLAKIVKEQAKICDENCKTYKNEYARLHRENEELQAEYDNGVKQQNEYEAQIIKLQTKINETALKITDYYSKISNCDNEIYEANKAISNAEKKLYWAWIATPYLIYALVDLKSTKEKSENKKTRLSQEIRQLISLADSLDYDVNKMSNIMNTTTFKSSELGIKLNKISQQISETIAQIADAAHIFAIWEALATILSKAVSAIENSFSQQGIINSFNLIIEMKNQIENAESESKRTENSVIKACIYRGNVLYQGQTLNRGEYIASLNKRFVALLTKDGTFAVYNTERMIKSIAENVERVTFDNDGIVHFGNRSTKRCGSTILIMQDDGNLVTYDASYAPVWATDTWGYGFTATMPFYVSLPSYSGSYKITSRAPYCFDIDGASSSNNAKLLLFSENNGNNQRFDFKQMDNGAYKITAVHSGKCLDVCGSCMDDGAGIIQYDSHSGQNQLFWVLPCKKVGCVKFVAVHSSKVIDVPHCNFANCTILQQYFDNGSEAQIFKLVR